MPVITIRQPDEKSRAKMPKLSARQLRMGLINGNYSLSQVDAAIAALPSGKPRELAKVEWEYATEYKRNHPLINQIGQALGMTPAQIDTLWMSSKDL